MALPGSFTKLPAAIWLDGVDVSKADVRTFGLEVANGLFDLYDKAPATLAGGTGGNTIVATMTPTLDAYTAGQSFWLTPAANITGAATLNIDARGAKTVADEYGVALGSGQLPVRRYLVVYDGTVMRFMGTDAGRILKYLQADDSAGSNGTSAQPWFVTAGGVTLPSSASYRFEGLLWLSRAAGTTSHTTSLLYGGTATLTSIDGVAEVETGDVATLAALSRFGFASAAAVVAKAASTSATEQFLATVRGILRVNVGGTFIPQFQYSVAPGGAPTPKRGSYFALERIRDNAVATEGVWA